MKPETGSVLAITAYKRSSEAIHQAIQNCDERGMPLNEIQQLELWTALLQSIDGVSEEFRSMIELENMLTDGGAWLG